MDADTLKSAGIGAGGGARGEDVDGHVAETATAAVRRCGYLPSGGTQCALSGLAVEPSGGSLRGRVSGGAGAGDASRVPCARKAPRGTLSGRRAKAGSPGRETRGGEEKRAGPALYVCVVCGGRQQSICACGGAGGEHAPRQELQSAVHLRGCGVREDASD